MIVGALDELGGVTYLVSAAQSHPAAFLSLLGKVMPIQVEGTGEDGAINTTITVEYVRPNPAA